MMGLPLPPPAAPPRVMLLDIPDDGGFYEGPEGPVTAEAVEKLLAEYKAKALARKQLESTDPLMRVSSRNCSQRFSWSSEGFSLDIPF